MRIFIFLMSCNMCLGFVLTGSSKTHTHTHRHTHTHTHTDNCHEARKFSSQFCRGRSPGTHATQGSIRVRKQRKKGEHTDADTGYALVTARRSGQGRVVGLGVTDWVTSAGCSMEGLPLSHLWPCTIAQSRRASQRRWLGLWALDWLAFLIEKHTYWGVTCRTKNWVLERVSCHRSARPQKYRK